MNRNVKSLVTILLILLLLVGVSVMPVSSEDGYNITATRNNADAIGTVGN